jgi:hypothetical protein
MSVFTAVLDWLSQAQQHFGLGWWLLGLSIALTLGGILLMRWLVVAIPADYFLRRMPLPWKTRHPLIRWTFVIGKNLLGVLLAVAGVAMLVTPGPGIVTLLAALLLLDLPGKRGLEQRLLALPSVLGPINRMRQRANQPPLEMPRN